VLDLALKHDDIGVRIAHLLPPSVVQSGPFFVFFEFFAVNLHKYEPD